MHTVATPDVGGIAMFAGMVAAVVVGRMMSGFEDAFATSEPGGVVLAACVIFLVGLVDDVRELSPPAKVFGTILAAMVLVYYGVTMIYFRVPLVDVFLLADEWVPLITILWLLGMSQAINLIDGLDGLAAGIVAIGAGAFFLYSRFLEEQQLLTPPNIGPLICIITVGMCLGFLPHNFNPARIFMGDGGALLLGLMMASATSVVGGRADPTTQRFFGQSYFFFAPLFIPLVHSRCADSRHCFRHRSPGHETQRRGHSRQGSSPSPLDESRPWAAAQRAHLVAVDRVVVVVCALPGVHQERFVDRHARRAGARTRVCIRFSSRGSQKSVGS